MTPRSQLNRREFVAGAAAAAAFTIVPRHVLGGANRTGRALIVVQFALSTVLAIAVTAMHQQMEYSKTRDLGFDDDRVFTFATGGIDESELERLSAELQGSAAVVSVAGVSLGLPGYGSGPASLAVRGEELEARPTFASPGYITTMGMRLVPSNLIFVLMPARSSSVGTRSWWRQ